MLELSWRGEGSGLVYSYLVGSLEIGNLRRLLVDGRQHVLLVNFERGRCLREGLKVRLQFLDPLATGRERFLKVCVLLGVVGVLSSAGEARRAELYCVSAENVFGLLQSSFSHLLLDFVQREGEVLYLGFGSLHLGSQVVHLLAVARGRRLDARLCFGQLCG